MNGVFFFRRVSLRPKLIMKTLHSKFWTQIYSSKKKSHSCCRESCLFRLLRCNMVIQATTVQKNGAKRIIHHFTSLQCIYTQVVKKSEGAKHNKTE